MLRFFLLLSLAFSVHLSLAECEKISAWSTLDSAALAKLLQPIFLRELNHISDPENFEENLERYWQAEGLSSSWRLALARSSKILSAEQDLWQNLESAWSAEKTQALTETLLKMSLAHPDFAPRLQEVSYRLLRDLSPDWQAALTAAINEAITCLGDLLGSQFATALLKSFEDELGQQRLLDPELSIDSDQGELALLGLGSIIAGQTARILGQQLANRLAGKIAERVLGKVLTSGIPVVGWVVGGVMISVDAVNSARGALPMIREELGKTASIALLQQGLRDSFQELLTQENERLAEQMSRHLAERWQTFQSDYALTLTLSARYPVLEALLLDTPQSAWLWFTELIAWLYEKPARFELALKNGDLAQLRQLPPESFAWLKQQADFQDVRRWLALPEKLLPVLFQQQWPKFFQAGDFSESEWQQLAEVPGYLRQDWQSLPANLVQIFLTWPQPRQESWFNTLALADIADIAYFSQKLSVSGREHLLRHLDADTKRWQRLNWSSRWTLPWLKEQAAALDFYFSNQGIAGFIQDGLALFSGKISLVWYLSKYPAWGLLALWLFLPWLWPRKTRKKSAVAK